MNTDVHDIAPTTAAARLLGARDAAVLWASLSVGLLVLVTGSFLVPALGIWQAFAAIAIGSALGGLALGAIAWIGASAGVPAMVLLRGPLGYRGARLAAALNVAQSLGWAVFEVIVIASAARAAVDGGPRWPWVLIAGMLVTALAVGGPLVVVRRVLRAVAIPVVVVAGAYLTWWAANRVDWSAARTGSGGMPFWLGVDLAIAIPISWAPLVADYARFGRDPRGQLVGTALGASVANAWFYGLGALLVLAGAADASIGMTPAAGWLVLGLLALAEVDKPFANLYSSALSLRAIDERIGGPVLLVALGAGVTGVALAWDMREYEPFLFLLGSCFVPLAGVLLAHAACVGARAAAVPRSSIAWPAIGAWLAGTTLYQWINPSAVGDWPTWVGDAVGRPPETLAQLGASLPAFALAAALTLLTTLSLPSRVRVDPRGAAPGAAGEARSRRARRPRSGVR